MNTLRQWFILHYNYDSPFEHQRARGLLWVTWIAAALWFVFTIIVSIPNILNGRLVEVSLLLTLFPPLPLYFIWRALQTGSLLAASRLFVILFVIGTFPITEIGADNFLLIAGPLVAAGLLLDRRWLLMTAGVLAGGMLLAAALFGHTITTDEWLTLSAILTVVVILLVVFNASSTQLFKESALEAAQIETIVRFSGETATIDSENAILTRVINFVRDELRFSYAQIYLLDERGSLNRRVRTGLGVDLVSVRENLNIGDANVISEAARLKQPVLVTHEEAESRRGHLLPAVTTAVALPMLLGDTILGVLDVQHESADRFTPSRIAVLTLLTNQTALVLTKVRDSETLRRDLQEQELLTNSLRDQIQELRQMGRESVSGAWDEYLKERGDSAVGFDLKTTGIVPAANLPETLRAALSGGQLYIETVGDEKIINIPIILRGQVLGAMAFAVHKDQDISQRQIEMAQNVSERLALSLETRRLFEQSQAQANRERKASETASLLISATDVNAVLSLAAESFNQALGAIHTRIYLQPGVLGEDSAPQPVEVLP